VSVKKFPTRLPFSIFGNFSEQAENLFLNFAWTVGFLCNFLLPTKRKLVLFGKRKMANIFLRKEKVKILFVAKENGAYFETKKQAVGRKFARPLCHSGSSEDFWGFSPERTDL
jgi:hypothetical protein